MAEAAIEITARAPRSTGRARLAIRALAQRIDEHREVRTWLRTNPPDLGRSTGARV
jgi:hypothetical protein